MIALVLAGYAQSTPALNGQLYRPSIDATRTLWTDESGGAPEGHFIGRSVLHYANHPLVFVDGSGESTAVVSDVVQLSLLAGYARGPVRLGIDAPIYLRSAGIEGGETGIGDLAGDLKLTFADRRKAPIGFAVSGRVTFPTTTVDAALGSRGLGYEVAAIVDKDLGPLLVAANIGTRGIPDADLENLRWSDQLMGRVGLGYAISEGAGVSLDVGTHVPYANVVAGALPAEAIAGGWGRISDALVLRGGMGSGFTTGIGAPRYRVITGISYEPRAAQDGDGDGIVDRRDACPDTPEDADGFEDLDGCPEPTRVRVRLVDTDGLEVDGQWLLKGDTEASGRSGEAAAVPGGAYTITAFAEGFLERVSEVSVPDGESHVLEVWLERQVVASHLTVRITDEDGADIPGASWSIEGGDEAHGAGASIVVPTGDHTVRAEAVGYRIARQPVSIEAGDQAQLGFVLAKARAELKNERIEIKDSIYFETAKAIIKAESHDLLDEVAEVLEAHPELLRIRIEGHTDSRGSASYNLKLSDDRAAAVRDYLVGKGVQADRLDSVGFGEGKPLMLGETEEAWANNRRVDFFVVERAD
ncbi:MAG: OmpA family protein [Alphaproteobacteria bacterium]|nr:OmpA family protein [Alphaproteobacteria bacterium]